MKKAGLFLYALLPLALPPPTLAPIPARAYDQRAESPAKLTRGAPFERNLFKIAELPTARIRWKPWSDRTWDHNRALLGERYTDDAFLQNRDWPARRDYNQQYSAEGALELPAGHSLQRTWLASLSPAEKYDVIMGTIRGGLYDQMSARLDRDLEGTGEGRFPTWWGICEGSSAASLAEAEPTATVWVRSEAYGVDVPFYGADVKGLVSLLWSNYNSRMRQSLPEMGRQCRAATRLEAGTSDPACFDVNPGAFTMALHHFVGRGAGRLIADTDASRVVWNHPVLGYDFGFFKPGQGEQRLPLKQALLSVNAAGGDPRRGTRARGTAYLVGVNLRLFYGENEKRVPRNGSLPRKEREMRLRYELELDENYNVLGGEWLSDKHPDILWTIPAGFRPASRGDELLGRRGWDGRTAPAGWSEAAYEAARDGVPLARVVEALVRRSAGSGSGSDYELRSER